MGIYRLGSHPVEEGCHGCPSKPPPGAAQGARSTRLDGGMSDHLHNVCAGLVVGAKGVRSPMLYWW